jgi:hypothetical protein
MATIEIKTPIPSSPLVLTYDGKKVTAEGGRIALAYWGDILRKGLYGRYGHSVDIEDTTADDLYSALLVRVPKENIKLDRELVKLLKESATTGRVKEGRGIVT